MGICYSSFSWIASKDRSNSFISSFIHSTCSVSNLEPTMVCLIWKSLPKIIRHIAAITMLTFKLLSHIVDVIYFFTQIWVPIFNYIQIFLTDIFTDIRSFEFTLCISSFVIIRLYLNSINIAIFIDLFTV